MNRITKIAVVMLSAMTLFSSCNKNEDTNPVFWSSYPNVLVTVKTATTGECYLQLDDKTTLLPVNMKSSPYKSDVRALAHVVEVDEDGKPYSKAVKVNWIDSLLTKPAVVSEGALDVQKYGFDPVEIRDNWITVVEDGYLTVSFDAYFGNKGVVHYINLVTGVDPDDPYVVELRHNAMGDVEWGYRRSSIAAFDISSLPDTEGKTVKLTVKYRGFNNEKAIVFDYCSGKSVNADTKVPSGLEFRLPVK